MFTSGFPLLLPFLENCRSLPLHRLLWTNPLTVTEDDQSIHRKLNQYNGYGRVTEIIKRGKINYMFTDFRVQVHQMLSF